ncbi:hypothetical protein Leryth_017589 [Lithospermum erythrorhizon]|nr:hypothetical protein Leryth_017589 [Lithospermum erythrorhizon]
MAQPAWEKIAIYRGGIVPVIYQRWSEVHYQWKNTGLVNFSVGGSINRLEIKKQNKLDGNVRNWGASGNQMHVDGQTVLQDQHLTGVVPSSWRFGQTFSSSLNF